MSCDKTNEATNTVRRGAGRAMALICVLSVIGCSGAAPIAELKTSDLCTRSKRAKPFIVAHVDERGEAWQGDAPRGEYDGVVRKVATALAVPKTAVFKRRARADCYDKAKDVWYPCVKVTRVDFSHVRGMARAPKMNRARAIAMQLCESEVRKRSPKADGYARFDSASFGCEVVQTDFCPVYKASAALKQEKKRLKEERRRAQPRDRTDPNCRNMNACTPKP
jgi:hypothetical protein